MRILLIGCIAFIQSMAFGQSLDKDYAAFDFISGERTIFEDDIRYEISEKVHPLWIIQEGAASTIEFETQRCRSIDAYYTKLMPAFLANSNLPDSFSIEYDTWLDAGYDGNPGIEIHLLDGDQEILVTPNKHVLTVSHPESMTETRDNPIAYFGENQFYNRWVHISILNFRQHLVVYLDQYKMLDIPETRLTPRKVMVSGNTSQSMKILLKNFRIATLFPSRIVFDENKFVTHAIRFDVDAYSLRPESISAIRQLYAYINEHKNERFEIGGHTDSDGSAPDNLILSQRRADTVKSALVEMGIDASRLTAKGYGLTKPLDKGNTPAAKALNRRVEVVRL